MDPDDIETEQFHFQYRALSQPRIFNDIITLRLPSTNAANFGAVSSALDTIVEAATQSQHPAVDHPLDSPPTIRDYPSIQLGSTGVIPGSSASSDYMIKLTISHAVAQSVKLTLFE